MRPQYCSCGYRRNRIRPQLRCDKKLQKNSALCRIKTTSDRIRPHQDRIGPHQTASDTTFCASLKNNSRRNDRNPHRSSRNVRNRNNRNVRNRSNRDRDRNRNLKPFIDAMRFVCAMLSRIMARQNSPMDERTITHDVASWPLELADGIPNTGNSFNSAIWLLDWLDMENYFQPNLL